jgi:hypothetical protein
MSLQKDCIIEIKLTEAIIQVKNQDKKIQNKMVDSMSKYMQYCAVKHMFIHMVYV